MAKKMAAQQWRWWRSKNGDGGAAMATAAQRQLRQCSNGNGDGGAAMGVAVVVAVVVAAQQWRRSK
jgi:hypothetical protein